MIVKLVLIAAAVMGAAAVTSLTLSWWVAPFFARGWSLMAPNVFALTGIVFPAWTLIAFALGAFAGVAFRRTVPALAAAMAAWAGLAIVTATVLRWRYQPAITLNALGAGAAGIPGRSWVQNYHEWVSYQPESRFWHFQLIEGGWLLALALLLGAATVWLVRRRAA